MDSTPERDSRAIIARALSEGDWPWAPALRADDAFIDGVYALALACRRAGVGEIALAAAVADDHEGRSALARLLLIWYRSGPAKAHGALRSRARETKGCKTLAEAFALAADLGAQHVLLPRWIADVLGTASPSAPRIAGDDSDSAAGAAIVFAEASSRPAGLASIEDELGLETGALAPAQTHLQIVVDAPADAALAQWFAQETAADEDVWSWPAAETLRPLVAPAMVFSASRLNGFVKCPRRWFFDYLCDAVEDEGSAAATYGKVYHEALEALHREVRVPANYSGNAILERLHFELDVAFERNRDEFASPLEFEVSRLKARAVAAHYARWLRAEADDHPMHVESVEALHRWFMGGHDFVGYIDRIDRPENGGPVTIYDYKTGRIDEDPEEYVKKIRRGEEAQLALYYTVRRMRGDDVGRLALISLRDPRDPVWVLALDMVDSAGKAVVERTPRSGVIRGVATPADMDEAIGALLARCDALTGAGFDHFEPGDDPPCSYCAYARGCREKPVEVERVFAR